MKDPEADLPKGRERPATEQGPTLSVRAPSELAARIDARIASHAEPRPSRPEAIRRLVALGLDAEDREDAADVAAIEAAKAAIARGDQEMLTSEETKATLDASTLLAFWRTKRGLEQTDLARAIGVSLADIIELEAGRRQSDAALLERLAQAFRVRIADLT